MSWFKTEYKDLETDELQAQLTGLVRKCIARRMTLSSDMDKYEAIITELARRKVEPVMILESKD